MSWATIIKELRGNLLLTQTEFASLLNVSFVSVNRWENGKCEPTMKQKRIISELCKKME